VSLKKSEELMAVFDEMVTLKREQNDSDFEARLHDLSPEEAVALAGELAARQGNKTCVPFDLIDAQSANIHQPKCRIEQLSTSHKKWAQTGWGDISEDQC
jgi:hypothetical protein